jgi:hypothetical protein
VATRAKLHTAWSSVLVDSTLTGALTISRNGEQVAVIPAGQLVWYDHFPPLGVPLTYSVTNGAATETAVITVPARSDRKAWLKSTADPNLSVPVWHAAPLEYDREKPRGIYPLLSGDVFVAHGPMRWRSGQLSVVVESASARDALEAVIDAGSVLYQPDPSMDDLPGWFSLGTPKVTRVSAAAGIRVVAVPFIEHSSPTLDPSRQIIPGCSWVEVAAAWASWTSTAAANATWVDLVRSLVT